MKRFAFGLLLIFLAGNLFSQKNVDNEKLKKIFEQNGDNAQGNSMFPVINDALPVIRYIEDSLKAEIIKVEYDIVFSSKDTFRPLFKDWAYGIFIVGDYKIKGLGIKVYKQVNNEWKLIKENAENSNLALTMLTPDEDALYRFEIVAKNYVEPFTAGHFALILFH